VALGARSPDCEMADARCQDQAITAISTSAQHKFPRQASDYSFKAGGIPVSEEIPIVMDMIVGSFKSQIVRALATLSIAELLEKGPATLDELAEKTELTPTGWSACCARPCSWVSSLTRRAGAAQRRVSKCCAKTRLCLSNIGP
jgi:hypothetical protein